MTFTPPPIAMMARQMGKTHRLRLQALAALGLDELPTGAAQYGIVKAAFTHKAKQMHADAGGSGGDIAALKAARDLLLSEINQTTQKSENETCPMCGGRGSVSLSFGAEPCGSCGGSGSIQK